MGLPLKLWLSDFSNFKILYFHAKLKKNKKKQKENKNKNKKLMSYF